MKRPTLIYDGDCDFCQYCVAYLKLKTKHTVDYSPYQTNAKGLDKTKCAQTIHLITPDKTTYTGAAAGSKVLSYGGSEWVWWSYQHLPGFAWISEKIYVWITQHRNFCFRVAKKLCGEPWQLWRLPFTMLSIVTFLILGIILIDALFD